MRIFFEGLCYKTGILLLKWRSGSCFFCYSRKEGCDTVAVTVERSIDDEIRHLALIRLTHKVHSLQCVVEKSQAKVCT
jgi:hypothetical protein